jgi:hypothetical protein
MARQSPHPAAPTAARTIYSSAVLVPAPTLPGKDFPHPVAVFNDGFCFTTLAPAEVAAGKGVYVHPQTRKVCRLFSCEFCSPSTYSCLAEWFSG